MFDAKLVNKLYNSYYINVFYYYFSLVNTTSKTTMKV